MKIAILTYSFFPLIGGAQVFAYNLSMALLKKGHEVHIYTQRKHFSKIKEQLPTNKKFNVFPILFLEKYFLRFCPNVLSSRLIKFQNEYKYDLWQVIGTYPGGYTSIKLTQKTPVVIRCFGEDIQIDKSLNYGLRLNPKYNKKIIETLNGITRIVALSPAIKDAIQETGDFQNKITEIPNAVVLDRYNIDVDKEKIRQDLGVSNDEIMLLTTGRYHRKKGYQYIPEAVKIIKESGHKIKWLIIGSNLDKIKPLIEKAGVDDCMILNPEIGVKNLDFSQGDINMPTDEIIKIYKSADIYVLPSLIEGMSNVLLEAMASGLAIVTNDAPGCRDIVIDGHNGLLAKPKDSKSLADCIIRIIDDFQLKKELIKNAQVFIKNYSWPKIVAKYESLYKDLINSKT